MSKTEIKTPADYVDEHSEEFDEDVVETAQEITEDWNLVGKSPIVVAASAVYAASIVHDTGLTQDEVAEAFECANSSIRKYYSDAFSVFHDNE